jgi:hypothetical protein
VGRCVVCVFGEGGGFWGMVVMVVCRQMDCMHMCVCVWGGGLFWGGGTKQEAPEWLPDTDGAPSLRNKLAKHKSKVGTP